ncbi:MAG TPA: hypothetical protein VNX25_03585 [Verrucomicrobiae bacterium]|nr:hypothetical protein [Verrucomicrobiae bacterium]
MRHLLKAAALGLLAALSAGCGANHFNVPKETYQRKVRTLGVAPIMMDEESDITLPRREELIRVVKGLNRRNEKSLVEGLQESGGYFAVRLLDADPDRLYGRLVSRRERRDDAGVVYNKYFFKPEEVRALLKENNVDAVMLVFLSGITRRDREYASNMIRYLESDYNQLILTAQIVDDSITLWEYPNFRRKLVSLPPLVSLQYPDFCEADANLEEGVQLKYKTVEGVKRALERKEKDLLLREKTYSRDYTSVFGDMLSLLKAEAPAPQGKEAEKAPPAR